MSDLEWDGNSCPEWERGAKDAADAYTTLRAKLAAAEARVLWLRDQSAIREDILERTTRERDELRKSLEDGPQHEKTALLMLEDRDTLQARVVELEAANKWAEECFNATHTNWCEECEKTDTLTTALATAREALEKLVRCVEFVENNKCSLDDFLANVGWRMQDARKALAALPPASTEPGEGKDAI